MTVTKQQEDVIARTGYGVSGEIGGIGRQTYYTPDGRRIRAIPAIRDYVMKDDKGKVIESGTRDANYDKGWLPIMPKDPVPYCTGCDNWHDTQEEVDACISEKKDKAEKWEVYAKKQQKGEAMEQAKDVEDLRVEVLELKGMIHDLTKAIKEGKNGSKKGK